MVIAASPQVNSLEKKPFLLPGHPSYNSPVISKRVINMAFPGIISRLHSDPDSLPVSSPRVCRPGRSVLAAHGHAGDAATVLAALPDSCSLYLEGQTTLPLRSHDGVVARKRHPGTGQWSHDDAGQEKRRWRHRAGRKPRRDGPMAGSRSSALHLLHRRPARGAGHPSTSGLSIPTSPVTSCSVSHPCCAKQLRRTILRSSRSGAGDAIPRHAWAEAYMKLEKKLHRACLDH